MVTVIGSSWPPALSEIRTADSGERAWWLPGWLARMLPKVELDKDVATPAPVVPEIPAQLPG